ISSLISSLELILSVVLYTSSLCSVLLLFFYNYTATTEIYTLSLHDALPISGRRTGFLQASAIEAEDRTGARRSCANTYVLQLNESEFRSDSDGIRSVTPTRPCCEAWGLSSR